MFLSRYSICSRPHAGFCCVQYTVCQNEEMSFSLDITKVAEGTGFVMKANQDDACAENSIDHITISSEITLPYDTCVILYDYKSRHIIV